MMLAIDWEILVPLLDLVAVNLICESNKTSKCRSCKYLFRAGIEPATQNAQPLRQSCRFPELQQFLAVFYAYALLGSLVCRSVCFKVIDSHLAKKINKMKLCSLHLK